MINRQLIFAWSSYTKAPTYLNSASQCTRPHSGARAALDAARCHGEREREAGALISLGNAHADLGETDHARELWSRAVEIAREEKLERVEAVALSCMAHNGMLNDTTAIQIF